MAASMADGLGQIGTSPHLGQSLARAERLAREQGHPTVGIEHLLFALTEDPDAGSVLQASNVDLERLRMDVSGHLARMTEAMAQPASGPPKPDAELVRILHVAGSAARQSPRNQIDGAIILAAVIGDGKSSAAGLLKAHGLTFEEAIRVLQQSFVKPVAALAPPSAGPGPRAENAKSNIPDPSTAVGLEPTKPAVIAVPIIAPSVRAPELVSPAGRGDVGIENSADVRAAGFMPAASRVVEPTVRPMPAATVTVDPLLQSVRSRLTDDKRGDVQAATGNGTLRPSAPVEPAVAWPQSSGPRLPAGVEGHGSGVQRPSAPPPIPVGDPPPTLQGAQSLPRPPAFPSQIEGFGAARAEGAPNETWSAPSVAAGPGVKPDAQAMAGLGVQSTVLQPPMPRAEVPPAAHMRQPAVPLNRPPLPFPQRAPSQSGPTRVATAAPPVPESDDDLGGYRGNLLPARLPPASLALPAVDLSRYLAGLMADLTVGRALLVELRVPRVDLVLPAQPLAPAGGLQHAVSMRMRSMDGRSTVEGDTPELMWLSGATPSPFDDLLIWRWRVTPRLKGRGRLQLHATIRSLVPDGSVVDWSIPDCVVEVRMHADWRKGLARAAWLLLAGAFGYGFATLGHGALSGVAGVLWRGAGF